VLDGSDLQTALGVGRRTAYGLVHSGRIPHLRVGRIIKNDIVHDFYIADVDFEQMGLLVNGVVVDKGVGTRTENRRYIPRAKTATNIRACPLPTEVAAYLQQRKRRSSCLNGSYFFTFRLESENR